MTNIFWFKGRIGRLNFLLTTIGALTLMSIISTNTEAGFIPSLFWIFFTWILICAGIKRFHDLDNPGVYAFLLLIPFAPIYVACLKGTVGVNQYGDDPQKNENTITEQVQVKPLNASEHAKAILKYKKVFNQDNEKSIKRSDIKYCRHCGVKNVEKSKFCSSCGKSFE